MDQQHIQQLTKTLLEEKAKIEAELSRIAVKNPNIKGDWTSVPQDMADPADSLDEKAQTVTNLEERRAIEQSLELRLKEIAAALQQLDAGTYGICTDCSKPIHEKRLAAVTTANLCMDCASKVTFS
ncbi:MAG: TraR/DksA C4-type zinc finger protein [Patescibacteria group bacterium]